MRALRAGAAAILVCASSALAGQDLVVPVAGRWRGTESTLTITNVANARASVEVTFVPASAVNVAGTPHVFELAPSQTADIDVGRVILENAASVGALLLRTAGAIDARVSVSDTSAPGAGPGVFPAIAANDAIGTGESTFIDVPALGDSGLRLFVVETRGFPLYFSVRVVSSDTDPKSARRYYISGRRQSTHALDVDLAFDRSQPFRLELHGINGSGRIVAAAAVVWPDKSIAALAMSRRGGLRHHMPPYEILAYALVAMAVIGGSVWARISASE